jgi:hypothetical protein
MPSGRTPKAESNKFVYEGDDWMAIVRDLPAVLSVEVQTLA